MIKNSSKQTGSAHIVIIVILVAVVIGALSFVYWKNFINKDSVNTPVTQTSATDTKSSQDVSDPPKDVPYTLNDALAGINATLSAEGCDGYGVKSDITTDEIKQVSDLDKFDPRDTKINEGLSYAYIKYGCGSQGSVALLKRTDNTWKLVSEDARIYPMCQAVRGKGFPVSIVDKCYENNNSSEPVSI